MTAELREPVALTPWSLVKVKGEENEEEESYSSQAASRPASAESIPTWGPVEHCPPGLQVAGEEEQVSGTRGGSREETPPGGFAGHFPLLLTLGVWSQGSDAILWREVWHLVLRVTRCFPHCVPAELLRNLPSALCCLPRASPSPGGPDWL